MITTVSPRCESAAVCYLIPIATHLMTSQWTHTFHPKISKNISLGGSKDGYCFIL